jgi:glycerophosphoryl diester phosphodiesterase
VNRHPVIAAHRGASAYRAEHTMEAYELALWQGADVLELDVRSTADGEIVVVHDQTMQRTAGCPSRVAEVTFEALRESCGPAAPLRLGDVLERFAGRTEFLLELKQPDPSWELSVLDLLDRHGLTGRAPIQSFDGAAMARMAAADDRYAYSPLLKRRASRRTLDALAEWASAIGVWHRRVDERLVDAAHERGLLVRAWVVNSPRSMEKLAHHGVDVLISDMPDVALSVVGRGTGELAPEPALALAA